MIQVFSQQWFDLHQEKLVWLANNPVTKRYFRHALRITEHDCPINEKINNISPNSFSYGAKKHRDGRVTITTDFRTHDKFAKRLRYEYNTMWKLFHEFDMRIANPLVPSANLGFDSFGPAYPDAGTGATTVDGILQYWTGASGSGISWTSITGQASATSATNTGSTGGAVYLRADTTTDMWQGIQRSIFTFDTSSIGSGTTVTAGTISFYGSNKSDGLSTSPSFALTSAAPAADNDIVVGDFDSFGASELATRIAYASYSTAGYNDMSLNGSGYSNIDTVGVSGFGVLDGDYDFDQVSPNWVSGGTSRLDCYLADQTGTTNDPKLVLTYTLGSTFTPKIIIF